MSWFDNFILYENTDLSCQKILVIDIDKTAQLAFVGCFQIVQRYVHA